MIDGYKLSRQWFDFVWENDSKVSTNHTALYMWLIELNNRLGWCPEFQITSKECMKGMSCKSHNTYIKTLNDLIEWGFIKLIKKSQNQYQCNVIALLKINSTLYKALDKAIINHHTEHYTDHLTYSHKPQTTNQETINIEDSEKFKEVWQAYTEVRKKKNIDTGEIQSNIIRLKLDRFAKDEATQILILEQSVINNWQDIFPLKDDSIKVQGKTQIQPNEKVYKLADKNSSAEKW